MSVSSLRLAAACRSIMSPLFTPRERRDVAGLRIYSVRRKAADGFCRWCESDGKNAFGWSQAISESSGLPANGRLGWFCSACYVRLFARQNTTRICMQPLSRLEE